MASVIIEESKKQEELEIIDPKTGLSWSSDLLGNHGVHPNEEGAYLMSQEDFDWWQKLTVAHQNADEALHALLSSIGDSRHQEITEAVHGLACDLEDYPCHLLGVIKGLQEEAPCCLI